MNCVMRIILELSSIYCLAMAAIATRPADWADNWMWWVSGSLLMNLLIIKSLLRDTQEPKR